MPDSSLELIIFSAVIALVITYMVVQIFNWTWNSIIFLLVFAAIIWMLNFLGFPLWADRIEFWHSVPSKIVEFIKMLFAVLPV